jgi:hypothetical protein
MYLHLHVNTLLPVRSCGFVANFPGRAPGQYHVQLDTMGVTTHDVKT